MGTNSYNDQNALIYYVQNALEKIQSAKSKPEKDRHLINLTTFLITSSNEIIEEKNYFEAAGRLYTAAYYLEEYYPQAAVDVYEKVNDYYIEYYKEKLHEGAINEAANIAMKIANIFNEKLQNKEKEAFYLRKAIQLIGNQIDILNGVGTPRELAGKFQTLSMLYYKLSEWSNMRISAQSALDYAHLIQDYSIISNSYYNISLSYEKEGKIRDAENILFKALDFFSKEATEYENNEELLPLSQLYQIIKKLNAELRNPRKYKIYSRKEASVYISMAKLSMLYLTGDSQTAAYYRAAALCYFETEQNYLDGASCFLLAAKYYEKDNRLMEAVLNYEDGAKCFEKLKNFQKANQYFIKAGKCAIKVNNLQSAIENFMWAYDISHEHGFKREELTELLCNSLIQLARAENVAENYFASATLLLEALYYKVKAGFISRKLIKLDLKEILLIYWKAIKEDKIISPSIKPFTYTLTTIISILVSDHDKYEKSLEMLRSQTSKTGERYLSLIEHVNTTLLENKIVKIERLSENIKKLLDSSEEVKIILKIANKYNSL